MQGLAIPPDNACPWPRRPHNLQFELATRVPPEVGLALKEEAAAMVNAALVAPAAMAPAAAGGAAPLAYGETAAAVAAVAGLRL